MVRRLVRLVRGRIAVKLTLTLVGFVAITVFAADLYLSRALHAFAVESLESRLAMAARLLHDEARAAAAGRAAPDMRAFALRAARPTAARVTLIAPDGAVLADSEVEPGDLSRLENHRSRPEVREALVGRQGRDLRTSATLQAPSLYVAIPVGEAGRVSAVLRLALPVSEVTASFAALYRIMAAGALVALALAAGIGLFVAGRVTRPVVEMQTIARRMAEGDSALRAPVRSLDEIGALGRALNRMMAGLTERIEALEAERAKVTAILEGMVEGVMAVDGQGCILWMNERARVLAGVGAGPVEGRPLLEAVRNADLHEIVKEARAAAEGVGLHRELRLTRLPVRSLQVTAVPLRLGAGAPAVVMVFHDVTELRRLEQIRTEFIANVSHELRTPLTAIHGYLETLLEGGLGDPERAREFLEIAHRHTERLGRLLADLTDLSNIELGRVQLRLAPVALGDVVESVFGIIRPKAQTGRVVLDARLPADLPLVRADRDRLAQVLLNLVDNAVKYSPAAGHVTVSAAATAHETVEVTVSDTGIGIPPADLPRITERFYRVDRARSRELGGTGLGLAIVKHLVLAHGGELRIDSRQGQETVVAFTLPTSPEDGSTPPHDIGQEVDAAEGGQGGHPEKSPA
ncbi:MAG TPA: PAS domain-containing sensor histidine kinase [Candidatus Rokubacteria bacterium]|nr:PAS domain-containing sensor histidine kinase [Candidatus Rokubacteria bacterium]